MQTMVRFENVSKRYNLGLTRTSLPTLISRVVKKSIGRNPDKPSDEKFLWALRDVSFELKKGESLALIGPNGAGKTTILKLLASITKPTSGEINVKGQLSALIELGAGFHPDLTGYENIYLNGAILGLTRKEIEQNFEEIVAFSELERFINTPVKRYSSGMKVRLGFAVASCINPDILLVDEVLAVGDASFRQKCVNRIQELINNGTGIIFVSHNLWLVQAVCSSAIYLENGQVIYSGETSEAINLYDRSLSEKRAEKFEKSRSGKEEEGDELEITKIEVLGSHAVDSDDLLHDQPAEVRLHYIAYKPYGNVNVVARIIRSDGVTCCMLRSMLDEVELSLESGKGVISIVLEPLQLRGGTFYVQAMIRDASDTQGISSKTSDWFYVEGPTLSSNEMNGVFEPNRRWSQRQIKDDSQGQPLHEVNLTGLS